MGSTTLHRPAYRQLCRQLRRWREQAGFTQRELAKRLSRPASYVHKNEVGERRIDPLEFIDWCRACNRDPANALKIIEKLDSA